MFVGMITAITSVKLFAAVVIDGWNEDITQIDNFDDLPENAKKYVAKIEELVGVSVDMVSVGPNRAQTIIRRNIFA
ncbi:adenylosuccinate synthetase family protein [Clostridioides difficile 6057]|nr:adenylosuccinate synthetase family protein [Clostridioides difficile 6057]